MASKKEGRLAGLAALAGLAYMNKDKLFGAKGETKAAAPAAKDARTYAEVHEGEDAQAGINMGTSAGRKMGEEMLARGEAEGKKIDGSDRFAGPATTKDTEFGDLEGAMKRNAETKTTPAKVASVSSPASKPTQTSRFAPSGSPVAKAAAGIGNAKAVVAPGGDRSARSDMQSSGKTGNAKAVVAPGGDRSARTDASSSGLGGVRRPGTNVNYENEETSDMSMKKGGKVKKMASGGMTSSASKRGDGIATKGKTRGRMC